MTEIKFEKVEVGMTISLPVYVSHVYRNLRGVPYLFCDTAGRDYTEDDFPAGMMNVTGHTFLAHTIIPGTIVRSEHSEWTVIDETTSIWRSLVPENQDARPSVDSTPAVCSLVNSGDAEIYYTPERKP